MWATRDLVRPGRIHCSSLNPWNYDIFYLVFILCHYFGQSIDENTSDRIFHDCERLLLFLKQIFYILIVNFIKRYCYLWFNLRLPLDLVKHIINCHRNKAFLFIFESRRSSIAYATEHCVGFPWPSHSINKYSWVKALKSVRDRLDHRLSKNLSIVESLIENFFVSIDFLNLIDCVVWRGDLNFIGVQNFKYLMVGLIRMCGFNAKINFEILFWHSYCNFLLFGIGLFYYLFHWTLRIKFIIFFHHIIII